MNGFRENEKPESIIEEFVDTEKQNLDFFNESCDLISSYISEASNNNTKDIYSDDIAKCDMLQKRITKIIISITAVIIMVKFINNKLKKKNEAPVEVPDKGLSKKELLKTKDSKNAIKSLKAGDSLPDSALLDLKRIKDDMTASKAEVDAYRREYMEVRKQRAAMYKKYEGLSDSEIDAILKKKDIATNKNIDQLEHSVLMKEQKYNGLLATIKHFIVANGTENDMDKLKVITDFDSEK